MNAPLRRVATVISAIFLLLVGAATYHQVIAGPDYRDDPRNLRVAASLTGRERGTIITADGVVIARSQTNPEDPRLFRRTYPERELYAHLVGYSTVLFGSTGLERAASTDLISDRDSTISGVINALLGGDLRPRGLRLTIDHDLQRTAGEALGGQRGAVVALDPATGAVLAMVSSPTFDPTTLLGTASSTAGAALDSDPNQPLLNRAIAETYAPGSTFKVVTAAAALEAGTASPGTPFPDQLAVELPGSTATISNYDDDLCADGTTVTLAVAFARSCNTVFAMLGLEVGADTLVSSAEAFGWNEQVPFELPSTPSRIPSAESFLNDRPGVAQSAIGQRDVRATPLQMALAAAAVANGGEVMEPFLVAEVFNADAEIERRTEPAVWRRAMSPSTADVLTELMERVITAGTGGRAAVPGVRIAGKTGTAEVPASPPDVWFVAFGPVDPAEGQPQIAIAVVVEAGGDAGERATGGTVAAPIARSILFEFFGIQE